MARPRPPHLQRRKTRHGKYIWIVQLKRGAPVTQIREEYGTPEFEAAYHAALNLPARPIKYREPAVGGGTLAWLWMLYRQSAAWKKLSPATQKQRENIMLHVLKKSGTVPISAVNRKSIAAGVEARSDTPFQAKNFLQTMRQLFDWAVDKDHVAVNPALGVKVHKPKTRGFLEWTYEDIIKYEQRWPLGTRQRVAFDVYMYTGLRRGDAARVGPGHVHNGTISLATEKSQGRTVVSLPMLDVLKRTLTAGPTGKLTFIISSTGKAYAKESLGNEFKTWCREAGVLDKSAHGLRKAAATRAAENGATTHELMAIFGWIDIKEAELYTRAADRKRLAAQAIQKLGQ